MSTYYTDDEDVDVHISSHHHSPDRFRYVQTRPRSYYDAGPSYLAPEHRTTVVARSNSRSRSRHRESPPAAGPVIINKIYNEHSDEEDFDYSRRQVARRHSSRSHSRSLSRSGHYMSRDDWEAIEGRRELERIRAASARDNEARRLEKELKNDAEFQRTKRELEAIKQRAARDEQRKELKREMELQRLRDEERELEEQKRREEESKQAVEKYKQEETERQVKEAKKKEENEKEYKRRLQEQLIQSGLDEREINAIVNNKRVDERPRSGERATYTRMRRKYLSIETLRSYQVEHEIDQVNYCPYASQ